MKIKCIRNCTGMGYEDFRKGQTRNLKKELANKLISFGYAEEVKGRSSKKDNNPPEGNTTPKDKNPTGSNDSKQPDADGDGDTSNENDQ